MPCYLPHVFTQNHPYFSPQMLPISLSFSVFTHVHPTLHLSLLTIHTIIHPHSPHSSTTWAPPPRDRWSVTIGPPPLLCLWHLQHHHHQNAKNNRQCRQEYHNVLCLVQKYLIFFVVPWHENGRNICFLYEGNKPFFCFLPGRNEQKKIVPFLWRKRKKSSISGIEQDFCFLHRGNEDLVCPIYGRNDNFVCFHAF